MRLQVFLSHSGRASRRASARLIMDGRVRVNGRPVVEPGYYVSEDDLVTVDGTSISLEDSCIYLMLNKPARVISSVKDPGGRVTVIDFVKDSFPQRLFPIGRLDYMSTGLIFITNDGSFAHKLAHPSGGYSRKYDVRSKLPIPRAMLIRWQRGIRIQGVKYSLNRFHYTGEKSVVLTLREGKNREIRNVFEYYKIPILSLHRFQFAQFSLGNLKEGRFRALAHADIVSLLHNNLKKRTFEGREL